MMIYVAVGMAAGYHRRSFHVDSIRAERWLQPFMIDAINNAPRMRHNVNEGADAKT